MQNVLTTNFVDPYLEESPNIAPVSEINGGVAKLCQRCQVIAAEHRFPASTEMLENGEITLDLNCTTEDEPEIVKGWRAFRGIKRPIARISPSTVHTS